MLCLIHFAIWAQKGNYYHDLEILISDNWIKFLWVYAVCDEKSRSCELHIQKLTEGNISRFSRFLQGSEIICSPSQLSASCEIKKKKK